MANARHREPRRTRSAPEAATDGGGTPGRRTRGDAAADVDPLDRAEALVSALRETHLPRAEAAARAGGAVSAEEQRTIRRQIEKLDAWLAAARRSDAARHARLVEARDDLVAQLEPFVPLATEDGAAPAGDERFVDTLVYLAHDRFLNVVDGPKPEAVAQESPALDKLADEVRSVVWLATSSTTFTDAAVADLWSRIRPRVAAIVARAQPRARAEAALAAIDARVVHGRATGLVDAQRDGAALASPDAGFYEEAEVGMGTTLKHVDKLYRHAQRYFYDAGRDAMHKSGFRDATHVAWNSFNFYYTLWFEAGDLPGKLEKAKQKGSLAQTATIIDLLRYGTQLCGNVVAGVASFGQLIARAQGLASAELELANVVSRSRSLAEIGKVGAGRVPVVPVINGIASVFTIVSGVLQLIDALQSGDDAAALAAGNTIAQGLTGLGGAVLALFPGTAALAGLATPVSATIYIWWLGIDAIGRLGGSLGEMKKDRKLRALGHFVDQAAAVANRGLDMAAAAAAMQDPTQLAHAPAVAAQIAAELGNRAEAAAADVRSGFKALATQLRGGDLDHLGGYPDLVERLDPHAKAILGGSLAEDAITLTAQCQVVFAAIDQLARAAIAERAGESPRPHPTAA
jgi:hypothetical protein